MPEFKDIIDSVSARGSVSGIVTADRYFSEVHGCFSGGFCPIQGADSQDVWEKHLSESKEKLSYTSPKTRILKNSFKKPEDGILQFDAIITTPYRDRDGDVLLTEGAEVDLDMPLLWQHIAMSPIGKMVRVLVHDANRLVARFVIADTELGRDAAKLIRIGALRISHGFIPLEFEPMDDENGWKIKRFHIYETSVVSVPSNIQARITSISAKKFNTQVVRGWLKSFQKECKCQKNTEPVLKPQVVKFGTPKSHELILRKEFDVERQHVEAAKLEYDWISRFCSCEVKQLVNIGTNCPRIKMGSFLTGLRYALKDSHEVDARRLTGNGLETPIEHELIQLNSKSSENFMVDGMSFRKHENGTAFVVKFVRTWRGELVEVYFAKKDEHKLTSYINNAWDWVEQNNFLKGEAFSLLGEFLPKSSDTWGDVFLEPENLKEVKKAVDLINLKGKECPNRGQVMMGPPGTGKTLSGRLIRNYANATFISIGGKDAYYYGGTEAVIQAFEMAKELAPSIIFMEDIDASLNSRHSIDVLKTEMDGIAKSKGVVTILTTNHPESFPPSLIDRPGRFHDVLKFGLPSDFVRKQMLEKWVPELSEDAVSSAVEKTAGYSGAHMYELCQYAKSIQESDDIDISSSIIKALDKISTQRELIDQELTADRRISGRFRSLEDSKSEVPTKKDMGSVWKQSLSKTDKEIEREYMAQLSLAATASVKTASDRISKLLAIREQEDKTRELEQVLGLR